MFVPCSNIINGPKFTVSLSVRMEHDLQNYTFTLKSVLVAYLFSIPILQEFDMDEILLYCVNLFNL